MSTNKLKQPKIFLKANPPITCSIGDPLILLHLPTFHVILIWESIWQLQISIVTPQSGNHLKQMMKLFPVLDTIIQLQKGDFSSLHYSTSDNSITMAAQTTTQNKTTAPPKDKGLDVKYARGVVPFGCTIV